MDLLTVLPIASIARSMPSLFTGAGAFARIILLVLFVISVIAWAIVWDRTRLFLRLRAKSAALRKAVSSGGFAAVAANARSFLPSIEGAILTEARHYVELSEARHHVEQSEARHHVQSKGAAGSDGRLVVASPAEEDIERKKMREALERRALTEISGMERHLIFLSTTASAAPFLGLLGTVWGIMSSFLSMGVSGSASIDVVGPGIAEALVTTIAGLAAAIPALVAYNLLVRQVHQSETRIDLFISRVIDHFVVSRAQSPRETAASQRSEASLT